MPAEPFRRHPWIGPPRVAQSHLDLGHFFHHQLPRAVPVTVFVLWQHTLSCLATNVIWYVMVCRGCAWLARVFVLSGIHTKARIQSYPAEYCCDGQTTSKSSWCCVCLEGLGRSWNALNSSSCVCFSLLLQLWVEGLRCGIPDNNPWHGESHVLCYPGGEAGRPLPCWSWKNRFVTPAIQTYLNPHLCL